MADSRTQLKVKFSAGEAPVESSFHSLIDSLAHLTEDVNSGVLATGASVSAVSQALDDLKVFAESHKADYDDYKGNHPTLEQVEALDDQVVQTFSTDLASVANLIATHKNTSDTEDALLLQMINEKGVSLGVLNQQVQSISASVQTKATQSSLEATEDNLENLIAAKANLTHQHPEYLTRPELDIYAKLSELAGKANLSHTHTAGEISGLENIFTTPLQVLDLISQNRVQLDSTTLLDDFYEKVEVDEKFRVFRLRTDQISLFTPAVISISSAVIGDQTDDLRASLQAVRAEALQEVASARAEAISADTLIRASISSLDGRMLAQISSARAYTDTKKTEANQYTDQKLTEVLGADVPAALDTLSELADAINDDENFSTTVTQMFGTLQNSLASLGINTANNLATAKAELEASIATKAASSSLHPVALSGDYVDLDGEPSVHAVGLSGSYNDLSDKPQVADGQFSQKNFTQALHDLLVQFDPATIGTLQTDVVALQAQVSNQLQQSVTQIQGDLLLLQNQVNLKIDEEIASLKEQLDALTALAAGTAEVEGISGIEETTVTITANTSIDGITLSGDFQSTTKSQVSLPTPELYLNDVFVGVTAPNQVVAYNTQTQAWDWILVDGATFKIIASDPNTDTGHFPTSWPVVNPNNDFSNPPTEILTEVVQTSTSAVVNLLEAKRFFAAGYAESGLGYSSEE